MIVCSNVDCFTWNIKEIYMVDKRTQSITANMTREQRDSKFRRDLAAGTLPKSQQKIADRIVSENMEVDRRQKVKQIKAMKKGKSKR